jgi:acetyltransferase-like isoleucine patch superfamily enzyme
MLKQRLIKILRRREFDSKLLRKLFSRWYGVEIGMYSYGCFDPVRVPPGTRIGRYCSFSMTCQFFTRNHGTKYLALHPYLYNASLGLVEQDTIMHRPCVVEDDVWIGHNATITAGAGRLGRGAVIAAGTTVTRDVPPYAIVAGNPGRVIKYRFSPHVIEKIETTRWWEQDKAHLARLLREQPELVFNPERYFE